MRIFSKLLLSIILVFSFSILVKADPIQITSGTVTNDFISLQGSNSTSVNIAGSRFFTITDPRFFFATGDVASPSIDGFGLTNFGGYSREGKVSLDGVDYTPTSTSRAYLLGGTGQNSIFFTSLSSFTLPEPVITSSTFATFSVQVPFSMVGYLSGVTCPNGLNGPAPCTPIPLTNIQGSGVGNLQYTYLPNVQKWSLNNFEYTFTSSTPEPTPEPATILLLGTGLAGIVGFAKRRKLKKQED